MDSLTGQTISQVENLYRNTLGYPVPLTLTAVSDAIIGLVEDRERVLGLRHTRKDFCGEHMILGAGELPLAILAQPWPATTPPPSVTPPPQGPPPGTPPDEHEPDHVIPEPSISLEERNTTACNSPEELRKEIAARTQDIEGSAVHKAMFTIFVNYENVDLAGYPSALRGALSGPGSLEVDIKITCPGPMDKAEVETRCESLPVFPNASYQARLSLETKTSSETDDFEDMDDDS